MSQPAQQAFTEGRGGRRDQLRAQSLEVRERRDLRRIGAETAFGDLARVQRAEHVGGRIHSSW
jgi:hypothetical protein